jgi:hypothetical protein
MLGKKFFMLLILAQQVVHKHQTLMKQNFVGVFGRQLMVQFLKHLLRTNFENIQNALIGSQVLSKFNLLYIILVRFGLVEFLVMIGLNAFEYFFDKLFLWRGLRLRKKVGRVAVVQQGLVLEEELAFVKIVRLCKGVILQSAAKVLAFSRAFRLFSPTLKSLLVRQVLLKLRQKLPLALFLFVPLQVYHL